MPGFLVNFTTRVTCTHQGIATTTMTAAECPDHGAAGGPSDLALHCRALRAAAAAGRQRPVCDLDGLVECGDARVRQWNSRAAQDSQSLCAPSGTPILITAIQTRVSGM